MGNQKNRGKSTDGFDLEAMSIADATALMLKPSLGRSQVKVEFLADHINVPVSTLYEWLRDERPLPAKYVPILTSLTDDPLILASLAAKAGYVLFPLPGVNHSCGRNFMQQQAAMLKKKAQLVEVIADSLDPDTGTGTHFAEQELRQLDLAITELVASLVRLRSCAAEWRAPENNGVTAGRDRPTQGGR